MKSGSIQRCVAILLLSVAVFFVGTVVVSAQDSEEAQDEAALEEEKRKLLQKEGEALESWQNVQWDPAEEHAGYLLRERQTIQREKAALLLLRAQVKKDIEQMEQLKRELGVLLEQADQAREKRVRKLVKVYQGMKAQDVVPMLDNLDPGTVLEVLARMKEKKQSQILAVMEPEKAAKISQQLIDKKH